MKMQHSLRSLFSLHFPSSSFISLPLHHSSRNSHTFNTHTLTVMLLLDPQPSSSCSFDGSLKSESSDSEPRWPEIPPLLNQNEDRRRNKYLRKDYLKVTITHLRMVFLKLTYTSLSSITYAHVYSSLFLHNQRDIKIFFTDVFKQRYLQQMT